MNVTGIIAEYNPFHNGHLYNIEMAKKITNCDYVACLMSGNFVQRGTPALIDKWNRTKMALENGIDLVIELPVIYSLSSADIFAYGGINIFESTGIINNIFFGSECGDIKLLSKIGRIFAEEPPEYKKLIKNFIAQGLSYPSSRSMALNAYLHSSKKYDDILKMPNNTLGIEYCKNIFKLNSKIKPYTVKRTGSDHNDDELKIAPSASAIRKYIKEGGSLLNLEDSMPCSSFKLIEKLYSKGYKFAFPQDMLKYIKYKSLYDFKDIKKIYDVKEGLENRIDKYIHNAESFDDLVQDIKSKRYTYSRISRILCQYFIGFEKYNVESLIKSPVSYIRVLGFNNKGRELLRQIKKSSDLKIITKIPKRMDDRLKLDIQSTNCFSLLCGSIKYNDDFYSSPIIIK